MGNFTKELCEKAISLGYAIVVLRKLEAKNKDEFFKDADNGGVASFFTTINGEDHFICNQYPSRSEIDDAEVNFDELYAIEDEYDSIDEFDFENQKPGMYFPQSTLNYINSDRYPEDAHDPCCIMVEELTGESTGMNWCNITFSPVIFVCNGKTFATYK